MINLRGLGIIGHPATIDDELVRDLVFPWNEDGGFETIGLAGEAKRGGPLEAEMWCGGNDKGGKTKRKTSGYRRHQRSRKGRKKIWGMGFRLAWSKVPVTITSLASACGLYLSRRERFNGAENAKNTIIRHGAPSENDLMEVLVLSGHDGEIELAQVSQKIKFKCKCPRT